MIFWIKIFQKKNKFVEWPSKRLKRTKTTRLHLADFILGCRETIRICQRLFRLAEDHVEGTYKKYKSVECIMRSS